MGALKEMLRQAIKDSKQVDGHTEAMRVFNRYAEEFERIVGKPLLWRSAQNPVFKTTQLVVVVKAYPRFVLVTKTAYNVDGNKNELWYGINYASLIEGKDIVELLEDSPL